MGFVTWNVYKPLAIPACLRTIGLSPGGLAHVERVLSDLFRKDQRQLWEEDSCWKTLEDGLAEATGWMEMHGIGQEGLPMGDSVCFANFQLAGLKLV